MTPQPTTRRDRVGFALLIVAGIVLSLVTDTDTTRQWFALVGILATSLFIAIYSRRPWMSTYAGRAAMMTMGVLFAFMTNAVLILWWPGGYGYPGWETGTEMIYLLVAVVALYKLRALTRPEPRDDPTT